MVIHLVSIFTAGCGYDTWTSQFVAKFPLIVILLIVVVVVIKKQQTH
ncbi:MAG: hypothetical protein CM1200mP16_07860 [Nitrospina sp.]|nr:MAG: hypothetical protein CM1200mP16_07860 [Nitrospina sp.]